MFCSNRCRFRGSWVKAAVSSNKLNWKWGNTLPAAHQRAEVHAELARWTSQSTLCCSKPKVINFTWWGINGAPRAGWKLITIRVLADGAGAASSHFISKGVSYSRGAELRSRNWEGGGERLLPYESHASLTEGQFKAEDVFNISFTKKRKPALFCSL